MEEISQDATGYPALLERLRQDRSELEQLPSWYRTQALILAVSVLAILAVMAGVVPLFVPPYLLLPFVLIPSWRLIQGERDRRAKLRAVVAQMRVVEERFEKRPGAHGTHPEGSR